VNGWKPKVFLPEAIQELQRYSWPGNVRELRNMVERLLLLADGAVDAALVRLALPAGDGEAQVMAPVQSGSLAERTDAFERRVSIDLRHSQMEFTE
jgi:DNA-binding NtrC family response regulator